MRSIVFRELRKEYEIGYGEYIVLFFVYLCLIVFRCFRLERKMDYL